MLILLSDFNVSPSRDQFMVSHLQFLFYFNVRSKQIISKTLSKKAEQVIVVTSVFSYSISFSSSASTLKVRSRTSLISFCIIEKRTDE